MNSLTPDEKILQLLNRITFGPRPGDVERVRQMGIARFLDQQLHPARIDDSAIESKVAALTTLSLSTEELAEDFQEMRTDRRGQLGAAAGRDAAASPKPGPKPGPKPDSVEQPAGRRASNADAPGPSADFASFLDLLGPADRGAPAARSRAAEVGSAAADSPSKVSSGEASTTAMTSAVRMEGGAPASTGTVQVLPLPRRVIVELAQEEVLRAVYSQRQLQEVMVQFWMNHFNIFAPKGADKWLITSFERDTIRPRALGKFEDLLVETAQSPAMLFYLDNWMSVAPGFDPRRLNGPPNGVGRPRPPAAGSPGFMRPARFGVWRRFGSPVVQPGQAGPNRGQSAPASVALPARRGLNENYGRELMELHTLGVDGGYTQKDVTEVARCLTGWTIDRPQQGGGFVFRPAMHDAGAKVVLGHEIPAGQGIEDGLTVLRILAHHPSTARFISLKLARRFVSDDPPPELVDRAAKVFLKTDGDLAAVLSSILTAPEFYSAAAYRAKVKSPLELVASTIRALDGSTDAGVALVQLIARMGQPMFQYQAPTGFPDRASTWIDSGSLLARVNFAVLVASNKIPGTEVDVTSSFDDLAGRLLRGDLSDRTRAAILEQATATGNAPGEQAPSANPAAGGQSEIAALLIASPDFQRR